MIKFKGEYLVTMEYECERTDYTPPLDKIRVDLSSVPEDLKYQLLEAYNEGDIKLTVTEKNLELTED